MIQRLAILIGGLGATAIFAVALGAAGLFPTVPAPPVQAVDANNLSAQADVATPTTAPADTSAQKVQTVTDKVYVEPRPSAPVVHVNHAPRTASPRTTTRQPRTAAPTSGSYDDGGYDDGGYDDGGSGSHNGGGGDD